MQYFIFFLCTFMSARLNMKIHSNQKEIKLLYNKLDQSKFGFKNKFRIKWKLINYIERLQNDSKSEGVCAGSFFLHKETFAIVNIGQKKISVIAKTTGFPPKRT